MKAKNHEHADNPGPPDPQGLKTGTNFPSLPETEVCRVLLTHRNTTYKYTSAMTKDTARHLPLRGAHRSRRQVTSQSSARLRKNSVPEAIHILLGDTKPCIDATLEESLGGLASSVEIVSRESR